MLSLSLCTIFVQSSQGAQLNYRQSLFVKEYLIDLNATQAAIRAGYSAKTAGAIGDENLKKPELARAIQVAMDKRAEKLEITAENVLREIAKLSFVDIRQIFDKEGRLLPIHELPDNVAASISSIKVSTTKAAGANPVDIENVCEVKLCDKKGSLELLGRHLKLFTDKTEHSGSVTTHVVTNCDV